MNIAPETNATQDQLAMQNEETSTAVDPVIGHIIGQLDPASRAPQPALQVEDLVADMGDDVDAADAEQHCPGEGSKFKAGLRQIIGARLIAAREMNGLAQSEAARLMGAASSTQLCLHEAGKRMPPHQALHRAAEVYGVAMDYLYGLDGEPDRDSRAASRNAVIRQVRGLLERNATTIADTLIETQRFDSTPMVRASGLCSLVTALCDGIDRYRDRNEDAFDETPCSALLLRTSRDARDAIEKVSQALDRADFRTEHALKRARVALGTYRTAT